MGNEITPSTRLKVEYRKVADLIPYARNARTHRLEELKLEGVELDRTRAPQASHFNER